MRLGASAPLCRRESSPQVIFVTRESGDLPGARIRCYQFANELARYGLRTRVLSFADTLGATSGAREHEMRWSDKLWFNARAFRWLARAGDAIIVLSRCNYHVFGPALHHLWFRQPLVLDLDDWEMRDHPAYRWGWYPTSKAHWLTQWLARRSVACLAASQALHELLSPWNAHVHYLPTGVDTNLFTPQGTFRPRAPVVFTWIGTFHHREYVQNLRFLLACFASVRRHLSQAQLEIVGDGLYRADVLSAIRADGSGHVRWRGWIPPEQIPAYLETVDVGCYPVARETPFHRAKSPTKVFEYMAMGKTVVASDVGEVSRVLRDGDNGLIAKTPSEFVQAMLAVGRDAGLREQLGQAAMRTVHERYSLTRLGQHLYDIVTEVCAQTSAGNGH